MRLFLAFIFLLNYHFSNSQECPQSTGLYTDDYTFNSEFASVVGHWDSMVGTGVQDFLVKYKHVDSTAWNNLSNLDSTSTSKIIGLLDFNTTYVWSVVAFCSENFQDEALWSEVDTFTTLAYVPCPSPSNLSVDNVVELETIGFADGNWDSMLGTGVDHFILNYKKLSDQDWSSLANMDSTYESRTMGNLNHNTFYEWRVMAYCSENQSYYSDWSVRDTFYVGEFVAEVFSPEIDITLSDLECDKIVDLIFTVSQDINEPDIQSTLLNSSAGSFEFEGLVLNQNIGTANGVSGINQFIDNDYNLIVYELINENKIKVGLSNIETESFDLFFNLENSDNGGVLIYVVSPSDNNSYTSGNSLELSLNDIFRLPNDTSVDFYVDISSELLFDTSAVFDYSLDCEMSSIAEVVQNDFIYPNPADNFIVVNKRGQLALSIYDLSGREVLNINTKANRIDISSLNSGLYLVHDETGFIQKLVVH
ncbi:MAG: T9SS type A sorting domain-containing protein [Flavobacteriales bacterium]